MNNRAKIEELILFRMAGITTAYQMIILTSLREAGEVRSARLAALCDTEINAVCRILSKMEERGYLASRTAKEDGRNHRVYRLSEHGKRLFERIDQVWERTSAA